MPWRDEIERAKKAPPEDAGRVLILWLCPACGFISSIRYNHEYGCPRCGDQAKTEPFPVQPLDLTLGLGDEGAR